MRWTSRAVVVSILGLGCLVAFRQHDSRAARPPLPRGLSTLLRGWERTSEPGQGEQFIASDEHHQAVVHADDASLSLAEGGRPSVRMRLEGARAHASAETIDPLPGRVNYLIGNEPGKWRTGVSRYAGVRFNNVYPGIDLVYRQGSDGLEYDFIVEPGADPSRIEIGFEGADGARLDPDGDLVLDVAGGEVRHQKPLVYQDFAGRRREVRGGFVRGDNGGFFFSVGAFDRVTPLTIDPKVLFSTKLYEQAFYNTGNFAGGFLLSMATDARGNVYVAGTASRRQASAGSGFILAFPDGFVAKLDAQGIPQYLTYLGGNDRRSSSASSSGGAKEAASGVAVDPLGQVIVAGTTTSTDFPIANAFQPTPQSRTTDGFLTKLDSSGSRFLYSTYLGATDGFTQINGLALDVVGNAYVTGVTGSQQFPNQRLLGPPAIGSARQVFVAKFNTSGGLVYSARFGGAQSNRDIVRGISVDAGGQAVAVGDTTATDFPIVNAASPTCPQDCHAGFVSKLNTAGDDFVYSTYVGSMPTAATATAADGLGSSYVAGSDAGFAFVARYSSRGELTFFQRVAPIGEQSPSVRLAVDLEGGVYLAGETFSASLPIADPLLRDYPFGPVYKSTSGGLQWLPSGYGLAESVTSFAFSADGALWAGTESGVATSGDEGLTWQHRNGPVASPFFNPPRVVVVADPKDAATIYALSATSLYKTSDSGKSWSQILQVGTLGLQWLLSIAVDPIDTSRLFVGGWPGTFRSGGIVESTDGGRTWSTASEGISIYDNAIVSLLVDPSDTSTLYASGQQSIYKTTDRAKTWRFVGRVIGAGPQALALDPLSPKTIYATGPSQLGEISKSVDGGITWTSSRVPIYPSIVVVDPRVPGTVYAASTLTTAQGGPVKILKSRDGGATWTRADGGILSEKVNALAVDPRSGSLYAAANKGTLPYVIHMIPGAEKLQFSTYLPSGRTPAIAVSSPRQIYVGFLDSVVVTQKIVESDCRPCGPRNPGTGWTTLGVCGC